MFAHLDCSSGASGDKFLGALVGAGLVPDVLRERLSALPLSGYSLKVREVRSAGLAGTKVDVLVADGQPSRDWRAIRTLIEDAPLHPAVKERALDAFHRLALAEALAHGVDVEKVHFHEVGAVDSIVDIVGTAIGMHELGIGEVWATPVRLGRGTVMTSHGELPVPAPATSRLLAGVPMYAGELDGEMTTPTGAALLRTFVGRYASMPPMRVLSEGWGAGSREFAIPNLLRLSVGELEMGGGGLLEVAVLQSVIDNVTPELLAAALALAIDDGALDAWAEPVAMKKGRLGSEVTVLARAEDAVRITELLMRHTGTLGVRRSMAWRQVAPRRSETVVTSLGTVRVKVQGEGASARVRPENDDVVAIARSTGLPLDRVARVLTSEAEALLLGDATAPDAGPGS
jgi:pyridinium-3,5-bisthiocarboxylic acid mononucleotide nickel chelatase